MEIGEHIDNGLNYIIRDQKGLDEVNRRLKQKPSSKRLLVGKRYVSIQHEVIKLQKEFDELSYNDKYYFLEDDTMKACKSIVYKLSRLHKEKLAKERVVWDKFWNNPVNDIHKNWDNYIKNSDERSRDLAQIEHDYKIDVENSFEGYHQFRKLIQNEFLDVWLLTKIKINN